MAFPCSRLLLLHALLMAPASAMYHTAGDILHFFSHVASVHPSLIRFELVELEATVRLPLATIARAPAGVNANSSRADSDKRVALLTFGQHAGEIITSEVAVWLVQALLGDLDELMEWDEMGAALRDAGVDVRAGRHLLQAWREAILERLDIQLVPIENLDGRELFEGGDVCRRWSGSGVDLNRNWGHAWVREAQGRATYGGPQPFSEPQSRYLRDRAREWRPLTFINAHSGEWAAYTPWDSRASMGGGVPMEDLETLMASLEDVCGCIAGPAGAVSGYLAYGSTMDYMFVELGVPFALTVEVYGSRREGKLRQGQHNRPLSSFPVTWPEGSGHGSLVAHRMLRGSDTATGDELDPILKMVASSARSQQKCFSDYNPTTQTEYRDVIARWVVMLMLILNKVAEAT